MNKYRLLLLFVACIALATTLAHMSCIYFGPACYAAQMAPMWVIESAIDGTLLAPIATTFVSMLFAIVALYALSAGQFIRKLPFETFACYTIATLCIVRGLLGVQLAIRRFELMGVNATFASIVWLLTGLMFFYAYYYLRQLRQGIHDHH